MFISKFFLFFLLVLLFFSSSLFRFFPFFGRLPGSFAHTFNSHSGLFNRFFSSFPLFKRGSPLSNTPLSSLTLSSSLLVPPLHFPLTFSLYFFSSVGSNSFSRLFPQLNIPFYLIHTHSFRSYPHNSFFSSKFLFSYTRFHFFTSLFHFPVVSLSSFFSIPFFPFFVSFPHLLSPKPFYFFPFVLTHTLPLLSTYSLRPHLVLNSRLCLFSSVSRSSFFAFLVHSHFILYPRSFFGSMPPHSTLGFRSHLKSF